MHTYIKHNLLLEFSHLFKRPDEKETAPGAKCGTQQQDFDAVSNVSEIEIFSDEEQDFDDEEMTYGDGDNFDNGIQDIDGDFSNFSM
jgi:hypothetical protein